ncbi:amino acid ABC transporter permease [Neoactinobaculum massilliense]|uniref:amino acid ABC transporter permease n=1 Tax=Neoactinobaculum massilliense TaxID=2364794 RepID=UPI000F5459A2|nr:amino acid ABC transporter permease [Neoactinobaculum massilliense]
MASHTPTSATADAHGLPATNSTQSSNSAPALIKSVPVRHWGRVIVDIIILAITAMIVNQLVTNTTWRWDVVWQWLFAPQMLEAVGWTLLLTVVSMVLGILFAFVTVAFRRAENPVLHWCATLYVWIFRGTPVYTQLIFWGMLGILWPTITAGIPWTDITFFEFRPYDIFPNLQDTMFLFAVLGLGLNEGAYLSEIFRAGVDSVDTGQTEAAKALGMPPKLIRRRIIMPQAMRVIIPPTGNETISMLKTTALVSAVPFTLDLTYVTNAVGFSMFQPIPLLLVAAIWYLLISSLLTIGQHYIERYYGRGVSTHASADAAKKNSRKQLASRQAAINAAGTTNPGLSDFVG